ncbi:MAG: 2-oxoacid:acceptor oxidoreductase family protein [Candidatus Hatepunaea meridiana]|nr:2-oxoacid:acceptor oxidoreductase family protein [Candidatus Hatepunaea meridiana]
MLELRFHSRGGQGGVIAGKLLAVAIFKEDRFVQSFPTFGVERRAAPVMAFVRIDDKPVRIRTQIYKPDHIIILDQSLLQMLDVTQGLKSGGTILINTEKKPEDFDFDDSYKVVTVDASSIAVKHGLGSVTQPIVNTSILGALAKILKIVKIESVVAAIEEDVPAKTEANVAAAIEAYEVAVG